MKKLLLWYRLGFAALVVVAVGVQFYHGLRTPPFSAVNFFSFFTIESNGLAAALFVISAAALSRKKRNAQLDLWRGAATLYMLITGIIYSVLLTGVEVQTPIAWVNAVLHYIFPVAVLLDWLLDRPAQKIPPRRALLWLSFPLLYVVYSLVRGPLANSWYPYPFLQADRLGYGRVLLNSLVIGVFAALLALAIAHIPRLARQKK